MNDELRHYCRTISISSMGDYSPYPSYGKQFGILNSSSLTYALEMDEYQYQKVCDFIREGEKQIKNYKPEEKDTKTAYIEAEKVKDLLNRLRETIKNE